MISLFFQCFARGGHHLHSHSHSPEPETRTRKTCTLRASSTLRAPAPIIFLRIEPPSTSHLLSQAVPSTSSRFASSQFCREPTHTAYNQHKWKKKLPNAMHDLPQTLIQLPPPTFASRCLRRTGTGLTRCVWRTRQ